MNAILTIGDNMTTGMGDNMTMGDAQHPLARQTDDLGLLVEPCAIALYHFGNLNFGGYDTSRMLKFLRHFMQQLEDRVIEIMADGGHNVFTNDD